MKLHRLSALLFISFIAFSCTSSKKIITPGPSSISGLRLINEYVVPHNLQFKGTTVGGLSGIDYDRVHNLYYLICDDRSDRSPARFYTARISVTDKGIDSVEFTDVITLLNKEGRSYPSGKASPAASADPESMRYNPAKNEIVWSSEGERLINEKETSLGDPAIYIAGMNGQYKDNFLLPANMHMQSIQKGPRRNGVFEGLAFSDDYKYLFVSLEEPLYEDGPKAGSGDSTAWVRWIKLNTKTKRPVAQYAYQIDPIPYVATPPGAFRVNGISEILYAGNDQFLVLERAFATGTRNNGIRIFIADTHYAQDISSVASIDPAPSFRPITKKLLLNMDNLGRYIDNVEGITFGPILPNGNRSLILVADNNFDEGEKSQFFLFEILP